jgi:hypothetical protein
MLKKKLTLSYASSPATFTFVDQFARVNATVDAQPLPLLWDNLQILIGTWPVRQREYTLKCALKAYYQHNVHTAIRYLSQPNHWMSTAAQYVQGQGASRYSSFGSYIHLISLLFLAATDSSVESIDGHTLESRFEHFVVELALLGRAHNWDSTRSRGGARGGKEEYDDEQGDKPSCYSGVKRRLFQSVVGHPLFRYV